MFTHWQLYLGSALLLFLLLAIGYVYEWTGERRDARLHPAPGRLMSLGDHKLHLLCKGSAAPAVVIQQGASRPHDGSMARVYKVCI